MLINDASITGSLIVNASSSFQNIAVSGNILPGTNNVYNLGSVDKYFKEIFVSTSSINFVDGNGIVTASLSANVLNSLIQNTGSANSSISSINTFTGSFSASVSSSIATISSSVTTTITTLSSSVSTSFSSSAATITSLSSSVSESVTSLSSSLTSVNTTQNNRLSSIESATGSYSKLSGGNTFTGVQIISGSTFIAGDLIVQGSSSIQYISASSVSIGTNTINLNTNTPAVRFAGISIFDSGSNAQTASIFWDGFCNKFIYSNPSSVGYSGGMLISGPRNTGSMGEENGLTCNVLATSIGSDHISSSAIFHDPTTTCFYNSTTINSSGILTSTNLVGTICARNGVVSGSSQITGITNAQLSNSTISGITLGSNLATLTIGTGLSGTSYNGSTAVTIANSGVTSIVAGTGISINQGTAAVTVTNTITNNNQLTNGAGYITSAGNATNITAYTINQNLGTSNSPTFCGLNLYNGISTGRSSYGVSNANLILYPSAADSTGYSGIDFRSGNNYPSDGAQIYFESNTGSSEKAKLTIRVENDLEDFMELRAGNITLNANTVSGGGQNPSIIFQNAGTNIVTISNSGTIVASGDVTAYSDVRIKENILNITDPLSKVLRLRGVLYNRTDIEDKSTKIGFIAQEVEKIVPEVVTYDKTSDKYGVSYGNITALLVEAIKEQQIKIDNLTIEVENLKKPKGL
jgi:hypothetical protein